MLTHKFVNTALLRIEIEAKPLGLALRLVSITVLSKCAHADNKLVSFFLRQNGKSSQKKRVFTLGIVSNCVKVALGSN